MSSSFSLDRLVAAVAEALGHPASPVPLHVPTLIGNCDRYVQQCIETGWVSTAGKFVTRFEQDLARVTGTSHAVAMVNGTCALELALRVAGVGPGDEVLCPSLTFVATANAIHHTGAVPHFVDSQPSPLGMDPTALEARLGTVATTGDGTCVNRETGRPIRAVVPVHLMGQAADISAVVEVAERFGIPVVEDAAEGLGTILHGRAVGRFGRLGILSFNGNKIVSTGGGGAIITDNAEDAELARHLSQTAKQPHAWESHHDRVGFNYRLPNLNAALGCAQIEYLDIMIQAKRALRDLYQAHLAEVDGAEVLKDRPGESSNAWLNTVFLDGLGHDRLNETLTAMHAAGILARPIWRPMHHLPMYQACPRGDLTNTESLAHRLISLPSSPTLYPGWPELAQRAQAAATKEAGERD